MMNNYNSLSTGALSTRIKKGVGDRVGSPPMSTFFAARCSWLVMLMVFLSLTISQSTKAQSTANYTLGTSTSGSLALDVNGNAIDMSTGTTSAVAASQDDTAQSAVANIGFDFWFMGTRYTQFSANSNGVIALGSTKVTAGQYQYGASSLNLIAPFAGDLETSSTGKVHYKLVGTAPNRCLVVEFLNIGLDYTGSYLNPDGTYQARLYESSGKIEFVYGSMNINSTAYNSPLLTFNIGLSSGSAANTLVGVTNMATNATSTAAFAVLSPTKPATGIIPLTELTSAANGSRKVYTFIPPGNTSNTVATTLASPTALTFASITPTTTTLNWTASSPTTGILKYAIYNSTDGGATYNYVTTTVLGTNTYAATGLAPSTSYNWRIYAVSEGGKSGNLDGIQSTAAAATYYWVGATGSTWNTPANWNTAADGTGTTRSVVSTTDILIVDGAGTTAGVPVVISVDLASFSIGQLKVTSNTAATLQSSATTTRTITLTGAPGDDFVIEAGSTLNLNHAANAVAFAFTGTGNTGTIAGTLNFAGSTSNVVTTSGGTSTLVTVTATGVVNNTLVTAGGLTGSTATLTFANGSNYNLNGAFTTGFIPLATWGATSNVNISGGTTATSITNPAQTFGNFNYNSTTSTATLSVWTTTTTGVIQGNLNVVATNTGRFRALTTGTLTVNGNVNVSGGNFDASAGAADFTVLGTINISGGTFEIANTGNARVNVAGNFIQTGGTIIQSSANANAGVVFNGTTAQTLTLLAGQHGTNVMTATVNNAAGVNLTSGFSAKNVNIINGHITGAGSVTYGTSSILVYSGTTASQTANAIEFPAANTPGSLTINNTFAGGSVVIPFSRSLSGTTGVLTFTSGILDNTGFVLTVPNTATGGITGFSAARYAKGAIARNLPASLVTGSTYTFPVGKGTYNPFVLVNPITNAGGTVTIQSEVFDANSGGTPGTLMATLNPNRYWASSITAGAANLTSTTVRLTDTTTGFEAIASSTTQGGAYDIFGGNTPTITATDITTAAVTSLPGFFVMGTKASASLSNLAISPTGNQCVSTARTVTVTVTPGGAAISGVVINYAVNGTAQTAIAMTNTSGNDWSGIIPTVTPANGAVTWSVTATDANSLTKSLTGTGYQDAPNTGVTATATANAAAICNGQPVTLTAALSKAGSAAVGAGASTSTSSGTSSGTVYSNPFAHYYGGQKQEYIILASELTAAGLTAGNITSLGFDITTAGTTYNNFTLSMANTSAAVATSTFTAAGLTSVFTGNVAVTATGITTLTFTTPFAWNGTSNVAVQLCWTNLNGGGTAAEVKYDTTSFVSNTYNRLDTSSPCATTAVGVPVGVGGTTSARPKMIFAGNVSPTATAYSWSDGTTVVGTTNNLVITPSSTKTYTATVTSGSCPILTNGVLVTVNPLPSAPTGTDSAQCGLSVPAASVADTNGFTTPTFKWYSSNVAATALQTSISTTYTTAISVTTVFYVSVSNPSTGCESSRTPVTVTVNEPDAVGITQGATASVCTNSALALSATSSNVNYVYTWTASPAAGSGIASSLIGASVSVTPTVAGTYVYTVSGTYNGCTAAQTITVTAKALPVVNVSAAPTICEGTSTTLTATTPSIVTGNATLGAGATTGNSYDGIFYHLFGGQTVQFLVKASELTALGLSAGNINSVAINMGTATGQAYAGFAVSVGTTAQTAMTATLISTGISQVYSAASYVPTLGSNVFTFSSPLVWNGTSNIVVQFCWSNNNSGGTGNFAKLDGTGFASCSYVGHDSYTPAAMCSSTAGFGTTNNRPQFVFNGQIAGQGAGNLTWTWNPGGHVGNTFTVSPTTNTTYTITGIDPAAGGCTGTNTVLVTVKPKPAAPVATNSSQCGARVPDASVADVNGYTTPTFKWYNDNIDTTALQSSISTTYTSSVSATRTFYVSVTNPLSGCESDRTAVTVTFVPADAVTVTPGATTNGCINSPVALGASSINTNYIYTWTALPVPGSGIATSLTGASVSPTPTAAGTYVYTVSGSDGNCTATKTVTVTVLSPSIVASASPAVVCAGTSSVLTAVSASPATVTLGAGASTSSTSPGASPFYGGYGGVKTQYLVKASELAAAGITAGNISSLAVDVAAAGSTLNGFGISMGATTLTNLTSSTEVSGTSVYAATYVPAPGINTFAFSAPFTWDGTSNIIVTFCWSNNNTSNTVTTVKVDSPGFTSGNARYVDSRTSAELCPFIGNTTPSGWNGASTTVTTRPKFVLTGQVAVANPNLVYTWTPGNFVGATYTVTPTATTPYTVSANDTVTGCTATKVVTVTVNPVATPPTATNATICGTKVSPAAVADPNGFTAPIFKWYADNLSANTTPLQSSTATTYGAALSATTTFYVSVTSPTTGCESLRTPITTTYTAPAAVALASTSTCNGQNLGLTATSSNSNYVYTWTASPVAGSGIATSITGSAPVVVPTIAGTYVYTVNASEPSGSLCSISNTITVTVTPAPAAITATASASTVCAGGSVNLFSSSGDLTAVKYNQNFENLTSDWTYINAGSGNDWAQSITEPEFAHGGNGFLFYQFNADFAANAWAITPAQTLQANVPYTITYWYEAVDGASYTERLRLTVGTAATVAGQSTVLLTQASITNPTYQQATFTYTPTVTGTYYFGLNCYSAADRSLLTIDDFQITAPASPTYVWTSSPVGFTSNVQNPTGVVPTAETTYTVTATYGGCSKTSSVVVAPIPVPQFTVSDVTLCKNTPVAMTAVGAGNAYTWSTTGGSPYLGLYTNAAGTTAYTGTNLATVYANPALTTVYTVTAINNTTGCQNTHTVTATVNSPGSITSSTPSRIVAPGQSTTFTVNATGTTFTYQWQVYDANVGDYVDLSNGGSYSNVTTATLTVAGITEAMDGSLYRCHVSPLLPCTVLTSTPATLTVTSTGFATEPDDANLCTSGSGHFSVTTTGDEPFFIQWQMSTDGGTIFNDITEEPTDAVNSGLTFTGVNDLVGLTLQFSGATLASNGYIFRAQVNFAINSGSATLNVSTPVTATLQLPTTQTVCSSGGTATFSVVATGTVTGYQWYVNNGTTSTAINGANSASLVLTNPTLSTNGYTYYCVVSGMTPCGNATSTSGTLIINNPTVAIPPAASTVYLGGNTTFSVTTSAPSPTYQWQFSSTNAAGSFNNIAALPLNVTYSGATTATLTVTAAANATVSSNYYYRVIITSNSCSVTSASAQMTISNYSCTTGLTTTGNANRGIASATIANTTTSTSFTNPSSPTAATPWYSLYTAQQLTIKRGQNGSAAITLGSSAGQAAAWVDFNKNGIFDVGELIGATTANAAASSTVTYNFQVPLDAQLGITRIRLRAGSNGAANNYTAGGACTPQAQGETEDYLINIQEADPCTGTPTTPVATASSSEICISGIPTLTATGYPANVTGISLQWYNSPDNTLISGATGAVYTPTTAISTTHSYYVVATCTASGLSAQSDPVTVTVLNPSIVSTVPATRCGKGSVVLEATGSAGTTVGWYAAATGGSPLFSGNSFTTPSLDVGVTTYYASASTAAPLEVMTYCIPSSTSTSYYISNFSTTGGIDNISNTGTGQSASGYGDYTSKAVKQVAGGSVTFSMTGANSSTYGMKVWVDWNNDGDFDDTGETAYTSAGSYVSSATGPIAVPAGTAPGNYRMRAKVDFVYQANSGSTFTSCNTTEYLEVEDYTFTVAGACESSPRVAVTATVTTPPTLTLNSYASSICSGNSTAVVNVTTPLANFDSYEWTPSTNVSGSAATGFTFNPTVTTTYVLEGSNNGSGCVNQVNYTVTVLPLPELATTATPSTLCAGEISTLVATTPAIIPSNYTLSGSTGVYTPITGTAVAGAIGDDTAVGSLPIGFTFNYNGIPQTVFAASSNGFIELGSTLTYANNTAAGWIPSTNLLAGRPNVIAPFWDDNNTTGGAVSYATTGTTGNRILTVQWTNMHVGNGGVTTTPTMSMQALLYEATGNIEFRYGGTSAALTTVSSSIGISGSVGNFTSITPTTPITASTTSSVTENTSATAANIPSGTSLVLTRPGVSVVTWAPITGLYTNAAATTVYTGGAATTLYAKPAATTTYVATATLPSGCFSTSSKVITVNPIPVLTTTVGAQAYCVGLTSPIVLSGTPSGVTFNITGGAAVGLANQTGVTTIPAFTATAGTATVTITPTANACTGTPVTYTITVSPATVAGTVTGGVANCGPLTSGNLTLSGYTGTIVRWESSVAPFTTWTPIANTTATYNPGVVSQTTQYRAAVKSGTCTELTSAFTTITINAVPTVTAPSAQTYCAGTSVASVALVGTPAGVTYDISGGAAVGLADITGVTSVPAFTATAGTATVTITPKTATCTGTAVTYTITVSPATVAGTITGGGTTVCAGSNSGLMTLSGQVGNVLRWESSVSPFSVWSPIAATTGATTYTSGALTQTTKFRAVVQSGTCTDVATAEVTTTVNTVTFGSVTSAPVCLNTDATVIVSGLVPNSAFTLSYTKSGVPQTPISFTAVQNATGSVTFNVPVTGAGQNVVITSIVRTDVTPTCPLTPSTGNSVTFTLSTNCSTIQPSQCNVTLATIDAYVYANIVASASAYRWRVTTLTGPTIGQVQSATTALRTLRLTSLATYAFDTQYKIEVGAMVNNVWAPYGTPCNVSTPATLTSLVTCGSTLTNMNDVIYANSVPFAAGYKFLVTDPGAPTNTTELVRATREFRMNTITDFVPKYNTLYNVRVAVKNTDGTYLPYGPTCTVNTPIFPTTSLQDTQCDDYIVPTMSTLIYANSYPGAIRYVFQLKHGSDPALEITKSVRSFSLSDFTGLLPGQVYDVRVRLVFDLNDPAGAYGKTCSVLVPAAARQEDAHVSKAIFSAVAYPNPFADNFNIDVTTSTEDKVTVKVYDMTGRLLESHVDQVSQMETLKVGDRYPSGVYNVIVTQGDNAKTLRVIKR